MEASRRGASPTRPADVRPVSRTRRMWRSRSGRQVRTATVDWRAVARQSMERVSSPGTYSRRLSNSVPSPRVRTLVRPSSSRRRASFEGRCLRLVNGEDPYRPGDLVAALAGEEAQGAVRADRHAVGLAVASAGGAQAGGDAAAFAGRDCQAVAGSLYLGAGLPAARGPRVAYAGAERAAGGVGDREGDVRRFAQACGGVAGAGEAETAYGGRQGVVAGAREGQGAFTARMPVQLGSQMPMGIEPRAARRAARPVSAISGGRGRGRGSR